MSILNLQNENPINVYVKVVFNDNETKQISNFFLHKINILNCVLK